VKSVQPKPGYGVGDASAERTHNCH